MFDKVNSFAELTQLAQTVALDLLKISSTTGFKRVSAADERF